ncbi:MAG: prolipoprotein diacylglyceryl transferase [Patescibacteria group bacterium]
MIPYFELTTFHIGPIPIQVWGLLVATGFLVGAKVSERHLKRLGLEHKLIFDMLGWMVLWALIVSRLVHVFVYEPSYYFAHPSEIIRIWEGGLSIYGGLIAATVTALVIMRRRRLDIWKYAGATIFGLPLGIAIGRIGCFLTDLHEGTATDFFLGVKYPDGIIRHNLGLYESLTSFLLFGIFLFMNKKRVQEGWYLVAFTMWYSLIRFFMDFLRIADTRYFNLTPAQYLSIGLFVIGILCVYRIQTHSRSR